MTSPASFRLVAAAFTPFTTQREVDLGAISAYFELLMRQDVDAVFVCGSTGEGALLTSAERRAVAERWLELARGEMDVIVHVGHSAPKEARELAAHAQEIGAAAVSAVAPFYFRPSSTNDLVEVCADIASGAPRLPFFYYHAPAMTGVNLQMAEFLAAAIPRIPNLGGIKFTNEDLRDFAASLDASDGCQIYFGRDEILLAAIALGASGAIGTTYNFMGHLFREIVASANAGDLVAARRAQAVARRVIDIGLEFGGFPAFKAITSMAGVALGPTRAPLPELPAESRSALRSRLERDGVAELAGLRLAGEASER